jgi:hypothetical protein
MPGVPFALSTLSGPIMCARVTLLLALIPAAATADTTVRVAPVVPPDFRLLSEQAVVKELALTIQQQQAVDKLRLSADASSRDMNLGRFGMVPANALRVGITQQINDFLENDLTKEQRARLDQIAFQLREREFGSHQAFVMAARDLRLRPDQLEDVRNLKGQRVEEIAKSVTSGKRFEKVKTDVSATNGETFDKMAEMLTRAQRERLKELRGKAIDVKFGFVEPGVPAARARYEGPVIGMYDLELHYIVQPSIREELKLTAGQTDQLLKARDESTEGVVLGRVLPGSVDKLHDLTEKALGVLKPEQRARFDQIMMQRRARLSREAVVGYPTAIAALKVTPIQINDLRAGKPIEEILSKDQMARFDKLLGEEFAVPTHVSDIYVPKVRRPVVPVSEPYTAARDFLRLIDRLQLNAEQTKKLRELAEDEPKIRELIQKELSLEDPPPVAGAGRAITAVNAVTQLYREAVEKQCWDVLDPQQQSTAKKIFGRGRK